MIVYVIDMIKGIIGISEPHCFTGVLLSVVFIESGCISTGPHDTESPPVTVSYEEFTNGIAKPVMEFMVVSGAFYKENFIWPKSLPALQAFAANKKLSFHAQSIKDWQVSDLSQETDITFRIVSLASLDASGKITTTWKMTLNKSAPDKPTLVPLSHFCVLHEQQDSIGDIFLWMTASAIAHRPLSAPSNKWCFAPLPDNPKVKEKLRRMMQDRQQQ